MNRNCLIVDDNRKSAFQLQMMLHKNGFAKVFVATEPHSINNMFAEENIEVFICNKLCHYRRLQAAANLAAAARCCISFSRTRKFKEDLYEQVDYHISEPYTTNNIQNILKRLEKERIITYPDFLFINASGDTIR